MSALDYCLSGCPAFAQLPLEIQSLLGGMPAARAAASHRAGQHLCIHRAASCDGTERTRAVVGGYSYSVPSVIAGTTSFPPMSQLVAPYLPATR